MDKYIEMTITQLKEEAKNRGLKGTSTMKKQELVELLSNVDKMLAQKQEKKAEAPAVAAEKAPVATKEKAREGAERPTMRPAPSRPQGSAERPAMSRPQGGQERPMMSRPQGSQERPMQSRSQGAGERPAPRTQTEQTRRECTAAESSF